VVSDEKEGGLLSSRLPRVMIVILTYFSDGSGQPEIEFIEAGPDQVERMARSVMAACEVGRKIEMFRIDTLSGPPLCLSEVGGDA
jgi:hypothetical protein